MTKFADRLFDDLMSEHRSTLLQMEHPAATRRRAARPVWLTTGAVAATAATAAGFVVFGGGAAAYAVTDNHDGTVSVAVSKPSGVDGANAALRKLGERVAVVPVRDGCPDISTFATPANGHGLTSVSTRVGPGGALTVDAQGIPEGYTALAAYAPTAGGMQGAVVLTKQPVPSCVSLPAAPPSGAVVDGTGGGVQSGAGDGPGTTVTKP